MPTIDRLTPDQESRIVEHGREWLQIGMCTVPADRRRAEAAITQLYAVLGESQPHYIWCDSPMTTYLAMHNVKQRSEGTRRPLQAFLRPRAGHLARAGSGVSLEANLWNHLGASLRTALGRSLSVVLRHRVWTALGTLQDSEWTAPFASPLELNLLELNEMLRAETLSWRVLPGAVLGLPLEGSWGSELSMSRMSARRRARLASELVTMVDDSLRASLRSSLEFARGSHSMSRFVSRSGFLAGSRR